MPTNMTRYNSYKEMIEEEFPNYASEEGESSEPSYETVCNYRDRSDSFTDDEDDEGWD